MSRKKMNPFVAAVFGIVLIPASVCLHAWNEYRTIHRTRGIQEAAEIVESIPDPSHVETGWNGKLVHLTGEAATEETLRDPVFGIEENGITLRRSVEMYQWDEDSKTRDNRTTYTYEKVWREGRIDSENFEQGGHTNPQPRFPAWQQTAANVMIGEYKVSDALIAQKDDEQPVSVDFETVKEAVGNPDSEKLSSHGQGLYFSNSGQGFSDPQIGDLRIQFLLVPNGPVSLMAGLSGNTFASYQTSNGEPIERLYPGTLTAAQVIEKLQFENALLAWGLRGLGFVLCLVGTLMIFSPAQALFRWIPLVGDIAGGLIFLVSIAFAVVLSLTTISISWIAVRPVLAIALLAVAGAAIYWMNRTRRNVQSASGTPATSGTTLGEEEPIMLTDDMMVD